MTNAILISKSESLIGALIPYLIPSGKDYSNNAVVFPGRRPAHFLRKQLAERIGSGFIPPRIFSIDDFVDYMYAGYLGVQDRLIDTYDAIPFLYEIHSNHPAPLGGARFRRLDDFFVLAVRLFEELEEFKIAGVTTNALREKCGMISPGNADSLPDYYERFYASLHDARLSTRAMRYDTVATADLGRKTDFSILLIGGLFILTASERSLISNIARHDNVTMIFQNGHGMKRHLQDEGIEYTEQPGENSEQPQYRFHTCPDAHGEIFALGTHLKHRLAEGTVLDENSVIVVPASENLFPLIHHGLSSLGDDEYNISMGYPLRRTPIYGFLNSLTDLIISREGNRYYAPDYLKFVLHPYTKNIQFRRRSDMTRVIFHTLEKHFIEHKDRIFFLPEQLETDSTLIDELTSALRDMVDGIEGTEVAAHLKEIHDRTIRPFESITSTGDLTRKCIELIEFIYERSTARLHPLFRKIIESMTGSLHSLTVSPAGSLVFEEMQGYVNFLRDYIGSVQTPFPGTPLKGLQVLGFLETRNLSFRRVLFLDANDDVISQAKSDDTIVPRALRKSLGMPTYIERERLLAYYFDVLLGGAQEVDFYFIEKDRREKSRFLQRIIWETERTGGVPVQQSVQYRVDLTQRTPEPIPKTERDIEYLRNHTFSASSLNTYLHCELRFYYRYILRLEEKEEASDELDAFDIGIMVHRILAGFFGSGKDLNALLQNPDELDKIIETEFESVYGREISGAVYLLRHRIRRQLHAFIEQHQRPLSRIKKVKILATEQKLDAVWNNFRLTGFIDRIEQRDGEIYILDYKISGSDTYLKIDPGKFLPEDRDSWEAGIRNLQLPIYKLLYTVRNNVVPEKVVPAYLLLGKNRVDESIEMPLFVDSDTSDEDYENILTVLRLLLEEIVNPDLPFRPTDDFKSNCPGCAFTTICGTGWV